MNSSRSTVRQKLLDRRSTSASSNANAASRPTVVFRQLSHTTPLTEQNKHTSVILPSLFETKREYRKSLPIRTVDENDSTANENRFEFVIDATENASSQRKEQPIKMNKSSARISIDLNATKNICKISPRLSARGEHRRDKLTTPVTIPGLCGLINNDGTGFINSAIQCLSNIGLLTDWANRQAIRTSTTSMNLIQSYCSLIQTMWSGENIEINANEFKSIIRRFLSTCSDSHNDDSFEVLASFITGLERTVQGDSLVEKLFHIRIKTSVTCDHCHGIETFPGTINFLQLSFPLGRRANEEFQLEQLIENYLNDETIKEKNFCSICQKYRSAKQQTNICRPTPKVLIIQLQRCSPFQGKDKIEASVRYKLLHENLLVNGDSYSLSSVSVHTGPANKTHCVTFAKNKFTEKWYEFDDIYHGEVEPNSVVNPKANLLIYEQFN